MKRFILLIASLAMFGGATVAYALDQQATDEQMSYASRGGGILYQAPQFEYPPGR